MTTSSDFGTDEDTDDAARAGVQRERWEEDTHGQSRKARSGERYFIIQDTSFDEAVLACTESLRLDKMR